MSSGGTISGNTLRGTPNRDRRGAIPFQQQHASSPAGSNIPRPSPIEEKVADGGSTVSASRQKQSKRDEVGFSIGVPMDGDRVGCIANSQP